MARPRPGRGPQSPAQQLDRALVADLAARLGSRLEKGSAGLRAELAEAPPELAAAALLLLARERGEQSVEALRQLAREGGELAVAAVEALGATRSVEAAAFLQGLEAEGGERTLRKAVGRALQRLRSEGVQPPPAEVVARLAAPGEATIGPFECWATQVDSEGTRAVWLGSDLGMAGLVAIGLALNDRVGIKDASAAPTTRRRFRALMEELRRERPEDPVTWVQLPPRYVQQLVAEAEALNRASGQPLPEEWHQIAMAIGEPPEPLTQALIYSEISAESVRDSLRLLEQSAGLFDERECRSWALDYEASLAYAKELEQARASPLIVSEAAQREREERIVSKAIEEQITPAWRRALRRRLEETAYIFLRTGREERARQALAAAVALAEESHLPLTMHPFLRALARRSIEGALQAEAEGDERRRSAPHLLES